MKNNPVEKKEKTVRYLLVIISLIIILLWVSLYYLQTHNIKTVYQTTEMSGRLYLEMVSDIIQSNLYSQDVIETLFFERAEMLMHFVMEDHPHQTIDSLRKDMKVHHVCIIDMEDNVLFSMPDDCTDRIAIDQLPQTEDFVLLETKDNPDNVYLIALRNKRWFVASIKTSDYISLLKPIQLSTIFSHLSEQISLVGEAIESVPEIRYLVIQDMRGIIAATENVRRMQKISSDEFLRSNLKNETVASRRYRFAKDSVLEVVRPFYLDEEPVLLRLGISIERIEALERNRNILFALYSVVFIGVLVLEFLFYRNHRKINKMTESLQKAEYMAGIGELGREVAHEIKNPLNAISMTLQRLDAEISHNESDEFKKMLDISFHEIERLNGIVERFLDFSRPLDLKFQKVNVFHFIERITNIFNEEYKKKNVIITTEGNKNLVWKFDSDALSQVLINIIKNAVESLNIDEKEKIVEIRFFEENNDLVIEITDNGSGISDEHRTKIWDLYFSTKKSGNGLGLPVSKKIISAHQGKMDIISSVNKGTEVIIRLPKVELM